MATPRPSPPVGNRQAGGGGMSMTPDPWAVELRDLTPADAAAASALVQASFLTLAAADWAPRAQEVFLAESSPEPLAERLKAHAFAAGAFGAGAMVGFALMPEPSLLGMLFVHPDWLRRGIAKALWERARAHVEASFPAVKTIELNATPNAVGFYRSVGFVPLSAEFRLQGCRATRMACWLPARGLGAEWTPSLPAHTRPAGDQVTSSGGLSLPPDAEESATPSHGDVHQLT
jgi:putative acetyltransferase